MGLKTIYHKNMFTVLLFFKRLSIVLLQYSKMLRTQLLTGLESKMTSLSNQLKRLAVPNSQIYKQKKRLVSLLFDSSDAAEIDREKVFAIGSDGFVQLKAIDKSFAEFEMHLFDESILDLERALLTKEANQKLDETIEAFLILLTPYLLLGAAQKCLEWLIRRFRIHEYNVPAVLRCALHYYESNTFVRLLQTLVISKDDPLWNWLIPTQLTGQSIAKSDLCKECNKNTNLLIFLCDTVPILLKLARKYKWNLASFTIVYNFYASLISSVIYFNNNMTDEFLNQLYPYIIDGLKSNVDDYMLCSYVIICELATKVNLDSSFSGLLVSKMLSTVNASICSTALLTCIIVHYNQNVNEISKKAARIISKKEEQLKFIEHLAEWNKQTDIANFFDVFFKSLFFATIEDIVEKEASELVCVAFIEKCLSTINLQVTNTMETINVIAQYYISNFDNNDEKFQRFNTAFHKSITILSSIYPITFDMIVNRLQQSYKNVEGMQSFLRWSGANILQYNTSKQLIESVCHTKPIVRELALGKMINLLEQNETSESMVQELEIPILEKFHDESSKVVKFLLKKCDKLFSIISPEKINSKLYQLMNHLPDEANSSKKRNLRNRIGVILAKHFLHVEDKMKNMVTLWIFEIMFNDGAGKGKHVAQILNSDFTSELSREQPLEVNCSEMNSLWQCFLTSLLHDCTCWSMRHLDALEEVNLFLNNALNDVEADSSSALFITFLMCHMIGQAKHKNLGETVQILIKLLENMNLFSEIDFEHFLCEVPVQNRTLELDLAKFKHCGLRSVEMMWLVGIQLLDVKWDKSYMSGMLWWQDDDVAKFSAQLLVNLCKYAMLARVDLEEVDSRSRKQISNRIILPLLDKFVTEPAEICKLLIFIIDDENLEPLFVNLCLKLEELLKNLDGDELLIIASHNSVVIPMLFVGMSADVLLQRQLICNTLKRLHQELTLKNRSHAYYYQFLDCINSDLHACILDSQYIQVSLAAFVDKQLSDAVRRVRLKLLLNIVDILCKSAQNPPPVVVHKISTAMLMINEESLFQTLGSLFSHLLCDAQQQQSSLDEQNLKMELYVNSLCRIYRRETAVFLKSNTEAFRALIQALRDDRITSIVASQITKSFFTKVDPNLRTILLDEMFSLCNLKDDSASSSAIKIALLKLPISESYMLKRLEKYMKLFFKKEHVVPAKRGKMESENPTEDELSDQLLWERILMLMEVIFDNKNIPKRPPLARPLFQLLQCSLALENCAQLQEGITQCLHLLRTIFDNSYKMKADVNISDLDVETLVNCLRNFDLNACHTSALLLLKSIAAFLKEKVIIRMIPVFSFVGSNLKRCDDYSSFQLMSSVIETIIPTIIKESPKDVVKLEDIILSIFRDFASSALFISPHRRVPILHNLVVITEKAMQHHLANSTSGYLWLLIALLFEFYVRRWPTLKILKERKHLAASLNQMCQCLFAEFKPDVQLNCSLNLVSCFLAFTSDTSGSDQTTDGASLKDSLEKHNHLYEKVFDLRANSTKQLLHFKYELMEAVYNVLESTDLHEKLANLKKKEMDQLTDIFELLTAKLIAVFHSTDNFDLPTEFYNKYSKMINYRVHHCLKGISALMPLSNSIEMIAKLLQRKDIFVKVQSLEMLSEKMQELPDAPTSHKIEELEMLFKSLNNIVKFEKSDKTSVKLTCASLSALRQMFAKVHSSAEFPDIMDKLLRALNCWTELDKELLVVIVSSLGDLVLAMGNQSIPYINLFMPKIMEILGSDRISVKKFSISLINSLTNITTSVLPFMAQHLPQLLKKICTGFAQVDESGNEDLNFVKIRAALCCLEDRFKELNGRVLLPAIFEVLNDEDEEKCFWFIFSLLEKWIKTSTVQMINSNKFLLEKMFLIGLEKWHCDSDDKFWMTNNFDDETVMQSLVSYSLKQTEADLNNFIKNIIDKATCENANEQLLLNVYRYGIALSMKLQDMFALFADRFLKPATELLDKLNANKAAHLPFVNEERADLMLRILITCISKACRTNRELQAGYHNDGKLQFIAQSLVDQFDNIGLINYELRVEKCLIKCIIDVAQTINDETYWKKLHYSILLKTRHVDKRVRRSVLVLLEKWYEMLDEQASSLIAESVPFLSELMEDESEEVEMQCKQLASVCEKIIGEPLQKYF
ncbi:HEAT repeat-containing protein 1 [Trichinella pseudospiralis]|uniref:HEAT repeat-containing protein 1 n=1 Tax=Trichinella pseudospiralis TaxID=6337 RepID=A0A0V1EWI7_TRIPS|nr:HEAT repeat-containing protein 1 [Trichinella pseudospiralis]